MDVTGSVTLWLHKLKVGDRDEAASRLWAAYFRRLVGLARSHLRSRPRACADEEDVALSAFDSFVRAAEQGRFPRLDDRDDLWQVLLVVTSRKAADLIQSENRLKRGGGRVVPMSAVAGDESDGSGPAVEASDPDPAEATAMAEGFDHMLRVLGDDLLRQIAVWKLEGHSNAEIAGKIGKSDATVERKLKVIREVWESAGLCG
jgi:DNA-directed RNA polymerase specialized sigma24 family protein